MSAIERIRKRHERENSFDESDRIGGGICHDDRATLLSILAEVEAEKERWKEHTAVLGNKQIKRDMALIFAAKDRCADQLQTILKQ